MYSYLIYGCPKGRTPLYKNESNELMSKNTATNKSLRRHLRRLAERKGITYQQAIIDFYGVKSVDRLEKNLVYSLLKNWDRYY